MCYTNKSIVANFKLSVCCKKFFTTSYQHKQSIDENLLSAFIHAFMLTFVRFVSNCNRPDYGP